ncbi:50S ribosomal protein L10 [Candidatus Omnitrophota bacterium]
MEKLGLVIRKESERILKDRLKGAESFLLVKYSGISASDLNSLRNSLSEIDSSLMVIKNSVSKRVFKSNQDLHQQLEGPCGLIFINSDLIATSQIIARFSQKNPNLTVKTGLLNDRVITDKEIAELSRLSSISALQSKVVGGLKSPICALVFSLKQIINKLALVLNQVKDKKNK